MDEMGFMDKLICKEFAFLLNEYHFKYEYQLLRPYGNWEITLHSFYNDTGCFTIHSFQAIGELEFYYAQKYCTDAKKLREKGIDVYSVEKEIWNKHGKICGVPNMFFWYSNKRILKVVAKVVKAQIAKEQVFFGIGVG